MDRKRRSYSGIAMAGLAAIAAFLCLASAGSSQALDGERVPGARPAPATRGGAGSLPFALVADASYASAIENEVVAELNAARTSPAAYAERLREYRTYITGTYLKRPGRITIVLNEGVAAVDGAIRFLEAQPPLKPLAMSQGLWKAASDHARDQSKTGQTGHTGSDGSTMRTRVERYGAWTSSLGENIDYGGETAREMVINLIVDDGVPSRGHRKNIFNAGYGVVGAAVAPHPQYGTVCVLDFAGGFE